jgi:predicted membrane chloride channel (bestrophin family)
MNNALSKFLEKVIGRLTIRTWLCFLLFIANFLIAHGAAMYWKFNRSPVELIIGIILTIILLFILSEPS